MGLTSGRIVMKQHQQKECILHGEVSKTIDKTNFLVQCLGIRLLYCSLCCVCVCVCVVICSQ